MWQGMTALVLGTVLGLTGPALADVTTIKVDLRDAPQGLFHADMRIPVKAGPLTLVYPRWIPGDHLPSGPIENLAGLTFKVDGKQIPWKRDVYADDAFHLLIPEGAGILEAHLDFLAVPSLAPGPINRASSATTENLAVLRWHVAILYPEDAVAASYPMSPSIILPAGWHYATAMSGTVGPDNVVTFPETSLERLIDSPVISGRYLKSYRLTPKTPIPHSADVVADDPADHVMSDAQLLHLANAIDQSMAMLGPTPFGHYDFLITLSTKLRPRISIGGQEHHESSDDTGGAGLFRDPAGRESIGETLSHEYVHAWNGKYRRPIGESTRNYQQPNDNSLLWVYEGLTSYLGKVVAVRSGAWSEQDFRDNWANTAAAMAERQGRQWRSLADTGVGLPTLLRAREYWAGWRRSADYYPEGALLWLDVDVAIRSLSHGHRSLDDFCRLFFAKDAARDPLVKPYDFDEIVYTLQRVASNDWRAFLTARLDAVNTSLPTDVLRRAGWSLDYSGAPNDFAKAGEEGGVDAFYSIGVQVGREGEIEDVRFGSPGFSAGLGPGMSIIGVNGLKYAGAWLRAALDGTRTRPAPIVLTIENGDAQRSVSVSYSGGQRYPMLTRLAGTPDLIAAIARPLETKR